MNLGNIIRNAMGRSARGTRAGGTAGHPEMNSAGRARAGRTGGSITNRIRGMLKRH